jgi:glycine oxidase
VLCTGAWTSDVLKAWLPEFDMSLAIQPVKGQMLVFDAKPDTLSCMVLNDDQYLIPRRDGKILAGSTVEAAGFEKSPTRSAKQQLQEFATALLPALAQYPISHHWAGLRPGTPQGIPYIGRHPTVKNLSMNAGHFRNGLVMGPASAQLLADLLLARPTAINPEPYAIKTEK